MNRPETLFLELTNRCNGNCVMCSHHQQTRPPTDMPLLAAMNIIRQVKPKTLLTHLFGEPTLYKQLPTVIKYASEIGAATVIDTNGQYMTPELFKRLQYAGLDRLVWSFGAATEEVYEQVWRGCNYWKVVDNIVNVWKSRGFLKRKPRIIIRMIVTEENRHQRDEVMRKFVWVCDEVKYVDEFHLPGYDRTPFRKRVDVPDCKQRNRLNREMVVKANGDVVLCCNDMKGEYVMGNLLEAPWQEVWEGKIYNYFREVIYTDHADVKPRICEECGIRPW